MPKEKNFFEKKADTLDKRIRIVKGASTAGAMAGTGTKAAGASMQATGKAVEATGRAMRATGDVLSKTRYGVVLGAPLKAGGAATSAVGKGVAVAGKDVNQFGSNLVKSSRGGMAKRIPTLNKATSALRTAGKLTQEKHEGLENHTIGLMIGTALFFDALQALVASWVVMDWLVGIFGLMTINLWFLMKGIPILTKKRMAAMGGSVLIEMIPFVAALPALTAAVTIVVLDTKAKKIMK